MNRSTSHPLLLARLREVDQASFLTLSLFLERVLVREDDQGEVAASVEMGPTQRWLAHGAAVLLAAIGDPIDALIEWMEPQSAWLKETPDSILVELNAGRDQLIELLLNTPVDTGSPVSSRAAGKSPRHTPADALALGRLADVVIARTLARSAASREARMADLMVAEIQFPAASVSEPVASEGAVLPDAQSVLDSAFTSVPWTMAVHDAASLLPQTLDVEESVDEAPSLDQGPAWDEESLIVNASVMWDWLSSSEPPLSAVSVRPIPDAEFRAWRQMVRDDADALAVALARQWCALLEKIDSTLASLYADQVQGVARQWIAILQSDLSAVDSISASEKLLKSTLLPPDVAAAGVRFVLSVGGPNSRVARTWSDALELQLASLDSPAPQLDDQTLRFRHLAFILERTGLSTTLYKTLRNQRNA